MQSKPLTTMVIWASVSKRRSCWPPLHRSARRPSESTFLHRQSISRKHPSSECKKSARPRKYWEFQRSNNWGTKWGIIGSEIKCNILNNKDLHIIPGGESGIRTRVRVSPKHAFQACAFSHSAISPRSIAPDCNEIRGWRPVEGLEYKASGGAWPGGVGGKHPQEYGRGRAAAVLLPLQDPDGVAYRDGTSGFDFREHAPAALQILLQAGPDFVHAAARPTGLGNPQPHH